MDLPAVSFINPTNEYATVVATRVNVIMKEGYVFWRRSQYTHLTDENGNPRDPYPEEISYSRASYNLPVTYDFSDFVIVAESDVPANQIFGTGNEHLTA